MCPSDPGQLLHVVAWQQLTNHVGTPDYFHSCSENPIVSVPNNFWGYEPAATGDAYVGLLLYFPQIDNYREYLEVQLTEPLRPDVVYEVSYRYSLAEDSEYGSDDLGMYFADSSNSISTGYSALNLEPHISAPVMLTETDGWTQMTFCYKARGGERYMSVGNFLNDAATTTTFLGSTSSTKSMCYVYLDDVSVTPLFTFNLGNDTTLCTGETLELYAHMPGASYRWQDLTQDSVLMVQQPGIYWVDVTMPCGEFSDTVVVDYAPVPSLSWDADTLHCSEELLILNATNPQATYLWQDGSAYSSFVASQSGLYWVEVATGCAAVRDSIAVLVDRPPQVNLGPDTVLCLGETLLLDATVGNAAYRWQDQSNDPQYLVDSEGLYTLRVTNACGVDRDTIAVSFRDCTCHLYVPNAFSPNNDGRNDTFAPASNCHFVRYTLTIADRWGAIIFQSDDLAAPWHGIHGGAFLPAGVYIYHLSYQFSGGELKGEVGQVTLVR